MDHITINTRRDFDFYIQWNIQTIIAFRNKPIIDVAYLKSTIPNNHQSFMKIKLHSLLTIL